MGSVTCTLIGSFQMSACRPTSFPTSDLREREHFCLISFEKCGESGYFIHGEVQDEVVNVLFASNFRRRQSTASARLGPAASWMTVTDTSDSHGRGRSRHASTYLIQKLS